MQVTRPVWASDHVTDEDFDYPYMKLFVSGNEYLMDYYTRDRNLVMNHFFPRVYFIDDDSHAISEITLDKLDGTADPLTDGCIHLITSNFYDPVGVVRGWLDKVWAH